MAIPTAVSDDAVARLGSLRRLQQTTGESWDPLTLANSGLFARDDEEIRCAFCHFWLCKVNRFAEDIDKLHATSVRFPECLYLVIKHGTKYMLQACLEDNFGHWGPHQGCETNGRITICSRHCDVAKQRSIHGSTTTVQCADLVRGCAKRKRMFERLSGVNCMPPNRPDLADLDARLQTFTGIPQMSQIRLLVNDLANAGFYYTGELDSLRCFYCDTVIRNWRDCTDHQHPWILHAQQNDSCMYLILAQGSDNVSKLRRTSIPVTNKRKRRADDDVRDEQLVKKMKVVRITA